MKWRGEQSERAPLGTPVVVRALCVRPRCAVLALVSSISLIRTNGQQASLQVGIGSKISMIERLTHLQRPGQLAAGPWGPHTATLDWFVIIS
jgi:hypothetical protein